MNPSLLYEKVLKMKTNCNGENDYSTSKFIIAMQQS